MGKINQLDSEVYNKISAGEVIERPASVVKELVENSIDAGATEINITICEGGIKSIIVLDNGSGLDIIDLRLACMSHATSKLLTSEDLSSINTLGFRGEALASIAAVSNLEMSSRTSSSIIGNKLTFSGGVLTNEREVSCNIGTIVSVNDLFFNTPARKKFLKKASSEANEIINIVSRLILANSNICFKLFIDDKLIFNTQGKGIEEAIFEVYGINYLENSIKIDQNFNDMKLKGYISCPNFAKPNSTYQTLVINGRYVINSTISAAIKQAYQPYLMTRNYPFYLLELKMDINKIDVNVHPNKLDVRFEDSKSIFISFYRPIKSALDCYVRDNISKMTFKTNINQINNESSFIPSINDINKTSGDKEFKPSKYEMLDTSIKEQSEILNDINTNIHNAEFTRTQPAMNKSANISGLDIQKRSEPVPQATNNCSINDFTVQTDTSALNKEYYFSNSTTVNDGVVDLINNNLLFDTPLNTLINDTRFDNSAKLRQPKLVSLITESALPLEYCGSLFNTYLIFSANQSAYLVDMHAAHERILYDKMLSNYKINVNNSQQLLIPYVFEVNNQENELLSEHLPTIIDNGFDIREIGNTSYAIYSVPHLLGEINLKQFVDSVLSDLFKNTEVNSFSVDKLIQSACKSAAKAGQMLQSCDIEYIRQQLVCNINLKCPHGRPIVLELTKLELDKMFKRIL